MESIITLCYGMTVLLGVAALAIQLLLRQKDMLVADSGIKENNTTIFFVMIAALNIIDFLYYYFWQVKLYNYENIMLAVDNAFWTVLAYYFIEFERKFARRPRERYMGIVFSFIVAGNLVLDFVNISDKAYYTVYLLLGGIVWLFISVKGTQYTVRIFHTSLGINRGVILLYDAAFLFECVEDALLSLYYRSGGDYMIGEDLVSILIWLILSSTNLYLVWKSCRRDSTFEEGLNLAAKRYGFSDGERAVAALLLEGKSNVQIADALAMSESAVKVHNHRLYKKLEVENRVQAVNKLRNS